MSLIGPDTPLPPEIIAAQQRCVDIALRVVIKKWCEDLKGKDSKKESFYERWTRKTLEG